MRFPRYWPFLVLSLALCRFAPPLGAAEQSSLPASLSSPVTAADAAQGQSSGMPSWMAEKMIAGPEAWRQKAAARFSRLDGDGGKSGDSGSAAEGAKDFDVIASGASLRLGSRKPAKEFIGALPSDRLWKAFEAGLKDSGTGFDRISARRLLASEILEREDLATSHGEAALDNARMTFLTAQKPSEARAAFEEAARRAAPGSAAALHAQAALGLLHGPNRAADYAEYLELVKLATQYGARLSSSRATQCVLSALERQGAAIAAPDRHESSDIPLRAAMRAAFEHGRTATIRELLVLAGQSDLSLAASTDIRYWAAMDFLAGRRFDEAINLFKLNIDSGGEGELNACSAYRMGECYMDQRNYPEAAFWFYDAAESWKAFPEVTKSGKQGFDFLLKSGLLDKAGEQAAVARHQASRKAAASLPNLIQPPAKSALPPAGPAACAAPGRAAKAPIAPAKSASQPIGKSQPARSNTSMIPGGGQ